MPTITFFTEFSQMIINSPWKRASQLLAAGMAMAILVAADDPGKPPQKPAQAPGGEAAEVARALNESWPDHPEWVDMLTAILQDEPMSSTYGWFRTAVAQTRFDWAASRKRFDRDGDGKVTRSEFPGDEADFARLDRDRDKALTAADFDFSGSALTPTPGAMVFMRADADGNGKVTPEEMSAFFKAADMARRRLPVALRLARSVCPSAGSPRRLVPPRAVPQRPCWCAACSARKSAHTGACR